MSNFTRRDFMRFAGAGAAATLPAVLRPRAAGASTGDTLTIAYSTAPPGWDPDTGPQTTSPGLQSIYRTIYDPYFVQNPDLTLAPGLIDTFGWTPDKNGIHLHLREGAKWQDGTPVTPDDVVWNLQRLTDPSIDDPLQSVWASIKNIKVKDRTVTFEVTPWRANLLQRLTFLGCYLLPPHYYEKLGKAGFEQRPMGSGPYIFDHYERGSFLRLKAFHDYWGGRPPFETAIFKIVTDTSSRVAEIESGSSDITFDIPYEDFNRLKTKPGLTGVAHPVADIAMMFFNNIGPLSDDNVRKAAVFAVNKQLIVERLLLGYGKVIDTLLAPEYLGYDPSIRTPYNPTLAAQLLAKSGYSKAKPIEFTVQTTRGYKPKDYETVEAIVAMWAEVGIKANIEVYEIAKHFELRAAHKLAPAAFYDWGNATADPESSYGAALLSTTPHSSWKSAECDKRLIPLFTEKDENKRLAGYRAFERYVAENAFIFPLYQYYQPVVYKSDLAFTPHAAGFILPFTVKRKA